MDALDRVRGLCLALPEVSADPEHLRPAAVRRHRGWIGAYLDVDTVDWERLAAVIEDAYRRIAPKSLIAKLEQQ